MTGAEFALTALRAGSAFAKGKAEQQQQLSEADRMESEAFLADTQALQRDTALRGELDRSLSTNLAARAANGLSALSPNAMKLMNEARTVSDNERRIMVGDYKMKGRNLRVAASAKRAGARRSLLTGVIGAAIPIAQSQL